jgi:hypothetical protein
MAHRTRSSCAQRWQQNAGQRRPRSRLRPEPLRSPLIFIGGRRGGDRSHKPRLECNVNQVHAVRVGPPPKFSPVPGSEFTLDLVMLAMGFLGPVRSNMLD